MESKEKPIKFVDMTFATDARSLCTIGPSRPHSSVSPGPDTFPASYSTGYLADKPIRGFSHVHVNAGEAKYGNFLFSPQIGLATALNSHDSEKANENPLPSEYNVTLTRYGIDCSMTLTDHCVFYKFVYPKSKEASLVIDISTFHQIHKALAEQVEVKISENERGNTIIFGEGFFTGARYNAHFYAEINKKIAKSGTFIGHEKTDKKELGPIDVTEETRDSGMGAFLQFETEEKEEIYIKVGISFKDIEKAKAWLDSEIPHWDYDKIKEETSEIWEKELGKITIAESATPEQKRRFYSCLYICNKLPRDRTGDFNEYPENAEMVDDHIAIWDTFRTLYPLYTLTDPEFVKKTVNSFITRFKINGFIRDIYAGGKERRRNQGGDNTDNIIVEAYLKKIPGIDWEGAYEIIKHDAENWRDDQNSWFPEMGVSSTYRDIGFIPADDEERNVMCCSKQLEYCYNDYLAAQMALGMGDRENYEKWIKRSENWKNIWNPDMECAGFQGFIWPKALDGSWLEPNSIIPDPKTFIGSWKPYFYEGYAYEYSFMVPHAVEEIVERMGGDKLFCDRIEYGMDNGCINGGNQPGMLQPLLPNHTNQPWRTADMVKKQLAKYKPNGTPGCEDSGCFASYYVFLTLGIVPNGGQDFYYITSPSYENSVISFENGKQFVIRAENFSEENKYIQSATLNGKRLNRTVIKHSEIICGGELVLNMGSEKTDYTK